MLTSLTCSCGASLETEARPGRVVHCPECDSPVTVPARAGTPVRTSGLALASVVVGIVGLFTVVLTVVALVLGVVALLVISRRREQVAGTGYAVFGIVLGLVFTPLSLFAYSKAELFEDLRERVLARDLDRSGPLEVVRPADGFAITRPSAKWGIMQGPNAEGKVMLAHPAKDCAVAVFVNDVPRWQTLEQCRDELIQGFRQQANNPGQARTSDFQLKYHKRLPDQAGLEAEEVCVNLRIFGNRLTYLARVLKQRSGGRAYILMGWAMGRRFAQVEPELRQAQDSFRLLRR